MSRLPRLLTLAAFAVAAPLAGATTASAASLSAKLSPNKGGSLTVAAPTSFTIGVDGLTTPYDASGSTRLKAIRAMLPEQLLFNTIGFRYCDTAAFLSTKTCPAATKLGEATVVADGGPDIGSVNATAELFFGSGFVVLARIQSESPAVIDEPVVGDLRSSGARGYGLQMYIPVPPQIAQPIDRVYPVLRSMKATVTPPTRSVKVPGEQKKVKLPLAGLGPCSGALNFNVSMVYSDALGLIDKSIEPAAGKASCKK